jgi:hypothetical protein
MNGVHDSTMLIAILICFQYPHVHKLHVWKASKKSRQDGSWRKNTRIDSNTEDDVSLLTHGSIVHTIPMPSTRWRGTFFSLGRIRVLDSIIKRRKRQMSRGRTSFQALLKRAVDLTNWSFPPSLKSQHQNQRPQPRGFYSPSFSTFTPSLS